MSMEQNKELVRRFLDEVMNAGDVSAIPRFMVAGSMMAGAFQGFITGYIKAAFPDFHMTIDDIIGEGDKVVVLATIQATQTGAFAGFLASGKAYTTTGIYMFKITNGKIVSGQWLFDRLDIGQQLGWVPTPSSA